MAKGMYGLKESLSPVCEEHGRLTAASQLPWEMRAGGWVHSLFWTMWICFARGRGWMDPSGVCPCSLQVHGPDLRERGPVYWNIGLYDECCD